MSETAKAVFLSYASQDAEAAKKICDALRAAGVEVWFDQSELRGGDAWDAKIRRQIKDCAMFVPIISANTQARGEGYFRLEWKLAVDRSHLMAEDTAFLFPIIIDDVPNSAARVPDKFREVQWTRLRLDETPSELAGRVAKLLRNEWSSESREQSAAPAAKGRRREKGPSWVRTAWTIVGLAFAVLYLLKPMWRQPRVKEAPPAAPAVSAPAPTEPSDARRLVAKAQQVFLALDSSRDDFVLAEEMLKQAAAKAPDDAEVWATYAYLHERYAARGWDPAHERRELARVAIQRALRLDPKSYEARFAAASLFTGTGVKDNREREQALRALLKERPDDKRVLRELAATLRNLPGNEEEILGLYDRANALPGGDPLALYSKSLALWFMSRVREADATINAALAQEPFTSARLLAAYLTLVVDGDLERAKRLIEELPSSTLQDDRGCFFGWLVYTYRGEHEQALALLNAFPRDWINDSWYHGPKGLLAGNSLAFSGRRDAALIEWRAALKLVDARLADAPTNLDLLCKRVELLAKLGDMTAARPLFAAVRQMQASKGGGADGSQYFHACVAMGEREESLGMIERALKSKRHAVLFPAADLRYDPDLKTLRDDPEFVRLLAEAERLEREDAGAPATPAAAAPSVDPKSVAVLAFTNLSDDKANEYFSDGISEELLTVLQKIPGLHVAARTSAFSFKGTKSTAQEIGEKLGVANIVEGSVRKAGNSVRITVHLSRAATGEERWSQSYTRELKDVFALQEELALAILGELRGQLAGEESAATVKAAMKGGTKVPEAYQEYLQGRFFSNRHSEKEMMQSLGHFERAAELDPNFALNWAGLAQAHIWLCEFSGELGRAGFDEHLGQARAALARALAIDPELPEGLLAKSLIQLNVDFDWHGAAETVRIAREKAPADPSLLLSAGTLAGASGDNEQALALFRQAVAIDPVNPIARSYLASQLGNSGHFAEAEAEYPRVVALNPAAPWAYAGLASVYVLQHRYDEAVKVVQAESAEYAKLVVLACAAWGQKRPTESDAALNRLIARCQDTAAYQIAEVYAYRGDKDRAFEWLARARRQRDGGLIQLRADPFMGNLLLDPRWAALLKDVGLPDGRAS